MRAKGLVSVAEYAKQIEEKVDKVEIEVERTDGGKFAGRSGVHLNGHSFDLLCVKGCEADENQYADISDDPHHGLAVKEDVDNRSDNQADQSHEQD